MLSMTDLKTRIPAGDFVSPATIVLAIFRYFAVSVTAATAARIYADYHAAA